MKRASGTNAGSTRPVTTLKGASAERTAPRRKAAARKAAGAPRAGDGATERHRRIAEAAFFRAERRGFAPGLELQDWLEAEIEIEERTAAD